MSAFGDSLLFVAVCAVAAVPPTGAALYCLRPYRSVWRVLAAAALAIATTGIAALVVHLAAQSPDPGTAVQSWSAFAILRILVAPLFALAFLLAGLVSPHRRARIALCAASLAEAVVFALVVVGWLAQIRG